MQFQLVIQFHRAAAGDFEKLASIEDALIEELGDSAEVDGHDIGSGEFNIFILTDNPTASFQRVRGLLRTVKPDGEMNVAYRDINESGYTILWPPNSTEFKVA
jgi:hypothetical protein